MAKNAELIQIKLAGLSTQPNNLSATPPGSLNVATNVVLNRDSIIESRRGQKRYGNQLSVGSGTINKLFNYRDTLLVSYDNKMAYDSDNLGTWTDYSGTYNQPDVGYKMRSIEENKNFYFSTSDGVKKLDSITGPITNSGVVAALGGTGATTGTSGFFTSGTNVAYRIVWGYTDANNNLLLGAPSQRIIVANNRISVTGTTVSGTNTITSMSSTGSLSAGMNIFGIGIPDGVTIVSVDSPTQVTISSNATASNSAVSITAGYNKNVTLTFSIPQTITTDYFYQIYRSGLTVDINTVPNDEMQLVYEGNPTNTDITNKYIIVTDSTPDDLRGVTLYTSPSVEGIAGSNYQPPFCKDMTVYNDYVFFANTKNKQSLNITLLGVGNSGLRYITVTGNTTSGSNVITSVTTTYLTVGMRVVGVGIPSNSIITIVGGSSITISANATANGTGVSLECQDRFSVGGVDYWAGSSQSSNQFKVTNSLDPASNITQTAYSLVNTINTYSGSTLYAFYQSNYNDLPGQMLFQEIGINGSSFAATSNNATAWNPQLPISGTSVSSKDDTLPNAVYFSKKNQPEAVPLGNFLYAGSADFPIRRIIALRQSIFILKDDGIYRITGQTPETFSVELFDNTARTYAPEAAVPFNNLIYCFTYQGVVAISDGGTAIVSRPIEVDLLVNSSNLYPNFNDDTFAVPYESERTYMLATVSTPIDTSATQIYCYNAITNAWTKWLMPRSCGIINRANNTLYMGNPSDNYIYKERKDYSRTDYADNEYPVTITNVNSNLITVSSVSDLEVDMTLKQDATEAIITNIDGTVLTIDSPEPFINGAAIAYTPISNSIEWINFDADNPGILKLFSECTLMFRDAAFKQMTVGFRNNFDTSIQTTLVFPVSGGSWGYFPWGSLPWGGELGGDQAVRTWIPRNKTRCNWLNISLETKQAFTSFSLQGITIVFEPISTRFR